MNSYDIFGGMDYYGGVSDKNDMFAGNRSVFGTPQPAAVAATPAATVPAATTAVANAASAIPTTTASTGATDISSAANWLANATVASPAVTSSSTNSSGLFPGGLTDAEAAAQANAVQGPQYAQAGQPGFSGGMTLDSPDYAAFHQSNIDRASAQQAGLYGGRWSTDPSAMWNGINLSNTSKKAMFQGYGQAGVTAWEKYWLGGSDWESMLQGSQTPYKVIGTGTAGADGIVMYPIEGGGFVTGAQLAASRRSG